MLMENLSSVIAITGPVVPGPVSVSSETVSPVALPVMF